MKQIPLTRGRIATVDDADYDFLLTFGRWYAGELYPQIVDKKVKPNKTHLMHVVLWSRWYGVKPLGKLIDHQDGDGFNCQRDNLRLATTRQNVTNSRTRIHNQSGFKGVHFDGRHQRYQAMMRINGRLEHIGCFANPEDAAFAFNLCAIAIHKEYARLNDVPASQEAIDVVGANKRLMALMHPNL